MNKGNAKRRPRKGRPPRGFQKSRRTGGSGGGPQRAPERTHQEVVYLKQLIENKTPVGIRMRNDELLQGIIEYYDAAFIRLTRQEGPNLFLFKRNIKYLFELPEAASG